MRRLREREKLRSADGFWLDIVDDERVAKCMLFRSTNTWEHG